MNGSVNVVYAKTSAYKVLNASANRIMSYSEPRIAMAGNIVIDRIRYMTGVLPRKLNRPMAYAAREPTNSANATLEIETIAEFRKATMKSSSRKTAR